jgi:hypothetical protein
VYADHDAVDTPALLPDGSIALTSVPEYLQISAARPHTDATDRELARPHELPRPSEPTRGGVE